MLYKVDGSVLPAVSGIHYRSWKVAPVDTHHQQEEKRRESRGKVLVNLGGEGRHAMSGLNKCSLHIFKYHPGHS